MPARNVALLPPVFAGKPAKIDINLAVLGDCVAIRCPKK
jgi:hypothetical protein